MLNPELDVERAAADFRRDGRVLIADFLSQDAAQALHTCLDQAVPWGLTYMEQGQPVIAQAETLRSWGPGDLARIRQRAESDAGRGFAFLYGTYMMVSAYRERRDPGLLLHSFVEFLNTRIFIGLLGAISGSRTLVKANAQATRYLPGHFLTYHNDQRGTDREIAYVLNLTRDWEEDWGGTLNFSDPEGRVSERYLPRFNSLALFRVPMGHFVSKVSDAAPRPRYAITGWALNR
ncbi:MAG TPA: 2OG-Fe(II) oxygenase family protein [Gammaproteobacteria bacterium]|jgi:Rps23 Pro-64 3,4-dihydroxylase Tpa1-like proline 4-hydroxylase